MGGTLRTSGRVNCSSPSLAYFSTQFVENLAGFEAKFVEEGLLQLLDALFASEHGTVEREVAQQVEGVGLGLSGLLCDLVKIHAALGELLNDFGALLAIGPAGTEFIGILADRADFFGLVIRGFDDGELFAVETPLPAAACGLVPTDDNSAVGEGAVLGDGMRLVIPPRGLQLRDDKLSASVRLVHVA